MGGRKSISKSDCVCMCVCETRHGSYLLHALQCLLQEAELLRVRAVLLAPHWLILALLLFEQLHLVPVGIQLAAQRVVLLLQGFGLQDTYRTTSGESPGENKARYVLICKRIKHVQFAP